ncbi:DinB family protein [Georgenia faecalis]|uniref:DinB family protein n=1 Tax=Georgenia faecalis TaxID=2483799 RepID=A0ABV9DB34_9MICO|nr:DinB family protein [Georgenia faecalis]
MSDVLVGGYGQPEFDWAILSEPSVLAMVRGQLGFSWTELSARLSTLTQAEFEWEPAPRALRVVRRGEERAARAAGAGEWVVEWPAEPDGGGTRTVAWLVAHLTEVFFERWEWTFGARRRRCDELEYSGDVRAAVGQLAHWVGAWSEGVAGLDEADVMTVGLSQATPVDAASPFGHLVLHLNRELIHHGSEICTLTDLYRSGA